MKPFNDVYSLSQRLGYAHIFWCMGALVIINTFSAMLIEGLCDRTEHFDIFLFFRPSLNGVLFPMFCLLVEGECQILMF